MARLGSNIEMDDLARELPEDIRNAALTWNAELAYPHHRVIDVINLATRQGVAILGVEVLQVAKHGLLLQEVSRYEVTFEGDWESFVTRNNKHAEAFVTGHPRGEDHAYVLTSTSRAEFNGLQRKSPR